MMRFIIFIFSAALAFSSVTVLATAPDGPVVSMPAGSILNHPVSSIPEVPGVPIGTYYYNTNGGIMYDPTGAEHHVNTPIAKVVGPVDIVTPESFPKSANYLLGHLGIQSSLMSDIAKLAADAADGVGTVLKNIVENCKPVAGPVCPPESWIPGSGWVCADANTQPPGPGVFIDPTNGLYVKVESGSYQNGFAGAPSCSPAAMYHMFNVSINASCTQGATSNVPTPACLEAAMPGYLADNNNKLEYLDFLKKTPALPVDNSLAPAPITQPELNKFYNDNSVKVHNLQTNNITNNSSPNEIAAGSAAADAAGAAADANNATSGGGGGSGGTASGPGGTGDDSGGVEGSGGLAGGAIGTGSGSAGSGAYGKIGGINSFGTPYAQEGSEKIFTRSSQFLDRVKASPLFSFSQGFFNSLPSGGSPSFTIEGGETFGTHTVNLEQTMGPGLQVLNSVLLLIFAFLSIRVIILKR